MARITDPDQLAPAATNGDIAALARLISLVERADPTADSILAGLFASTGTAWTTGLTGSPGAGKSTLTERLIARVRANGDRVAVAAVDPSSPFTGGAILGDRIRMQDHVDDPGVYIRSLASRGHLGGISEATPRVLAVLDAVGFPEVLVETVGVGQAEVAVAGNTDTTLVVLNPRWGDSIQAAKAGLLEIGDIFVVNKADRGGVDDTVRDLKQMLELGAAHDTAKPLWWPPIVPTVASTGEGTDALWDAMQTHRRHLVETGSLAGRRRQRVATEIRAAVTRAVERRVQHTVGDAGWDEIVDDVVARRTDPWTAARTITDQIT